MTCRNPKCLKRAKDLRETKAENQKFWKFWRSLLKTLAREARKGGEQRYVKKKGRR